MTTETTKKKSPTKSTSPKKPRQKKLTLKSIQAKEASIDTLSTYLLNEETNEVIKYYKIFNESKIQFLLTEAFEKIQYAAENDIEYFTTDSDLYNFISYLSIKYFTHLGEELQDSALEDDIAAISALISTGLYKTILNDVFDGNQLQRIFETMSEHIELSGRVEKYQAELMAQVEDKVESPVIKNKIANKSNLKVLN